MRMTVHLNLVPSMTEHEVEAVQAMVRNVVSTSVLGRVVSSIDFDEGEGDIRVVDNTPNPDLPPVSGGDAPLMQPTPVPVG